MKPSDQVESMLEAIRDTLNRADEERNLNWQIGEILIALNRITDILEMTNKRIDEIHEKERVERVCREYGIA